MVLLSTANSSGNLVALAMEIYSICRPYRGPAEAWPRGDLAIQWGNKFESELRYRLAD